MSDESHSIAGIWVILVAIVASCSFLTFNHRRPAAPSYSRIQAACRQILAASRELEKRGAGDDEWAAFEPHALARLNSMSDELRASLEEHYERDAAGILDDRDYRGAAEIGRPLLVLARDLLPQHIRGARGGGADKSLDRTIDLLLDEVGKVLDSLRRESGAGNGPGAIRSKMLFHARPWQWAGRPRDRHIPSSDAPLNYPPALLHWHT